jgi:hypothetical protein
MSVKIMEYKGIHMSSQILRSKQKSKTLEQFASKVFSHIFFQIICVGTSLNGVSQVFAVAGSPADAALKAALKSGEVLEKAHRDMCSRCSGTGGSCSNSVAVGVKSLGEAEVSMGAGNASGATVGAAAGGTDAGNSTQTIGNGVVGENAGNMGGGQFGACAAKANEAVEKYSEAEASIQKNLATVTDPTTKATCQGLYRNYNQSAVQARNDASSVAQLCGQDAVASQSLAKASQTAQNAGKGIDGKSLLGGALLGAGLAAAAMGMMGGDDPETPKEPEKVEEVKKEEAPKNPDGTCPSGMQMISTGVCTVPGSGASASLTPIKPEDQIITGNQGKLGAGNEDPLGTGRGIAADSTGTSATTGGASSTGRGIAANNASGSIGGSSGAGGAGAGKAGAGSASGLSANGGGGANSLASNLGYNSFASSDGKAAGETVASVTVDTYVDGIDEKGPYVFKFINGKKVKVRVKCKTNRCEVRNEIRNKIAADPLLQ